jgi:orotidine-5'-phosphate decarboxylase
MNRNKIIEEIRRKKSYLCVGLDTDINKIPKALLKEDDPVFAFNKIVIEETQEYAVAYKMNMAFYECLGKRGWESLEKTLHIIPEDIFKIADAKRGDIGNTSKKYAETFFKTYHFDAITVSPYMGIDSISPFLEFENTWVIILGLTSNKGSEDFQMLETKEGRLYEEVLRKASSWGNINNIMFVVGATHPEHFSAIRKIIPDHFLLIPGVGTQGGDLEKISQHALNKDYSVLVNVSRDIIYSNQHIDFPKNIRKAVKNYRDQMRKFII